MLEELESKNLSELREIADSLAIDYMKNIGKAKLIEKIIADENLVNGTPKEVEGVVVKKNETVTQMKKRMSILVRCRISANDPQYRERNFISMQVGNAKHVVGKHVPFDTIWHVQKVVLDRLKLRTYRQTKFKTDRVTGNKTPITTIKPSFAIEILPALTAKELKKLAAEQAARGSVDVEQQ